MSYNALPCFRLRLHLLFACLLGGLLPAMASAQMQIDEVGISSGPQREAGTFVDYFIDPVVSGSGIDTVVLSSESGTLLEALAEIAPGVFRCLSAIPSEPCGNFTSLAEISALGDLTFFFLGDLAEVDSLTIPLADYDPGSGQVGFPAVIFPVDGQFEVSATAAMEWSTPPSWVQAILVVLEESFTGFSPDSDLFLGSPVTTTTWSPAGMVDGTVYDFEVSFLEIIEFEDLRASNGGLGFLYSSAFESFNVIGFAVPEPATLPSLALGMALLLGLMRRRRPARTADPRQRSSAPSRRQ